MQIETRKIVFSGRVQGVGFRMTTVQMSGDLKLEGTVRNVANGDVELVVRGTAEEIEKLAGRLREHFGAFVRNMEQTSLAPHDSARAVGKNAGIRVIG